MLSLYLLLWCAVTVSSPLLVLLGLVHARWSGNRGASLRVAALLWSYLTAELVGVAWAQWIWLRWRLGGGAEDYRRANVELQGRWLQALLGALMRLFELDLEVSGIECARPGPALLFLRHTSFIDTLLPGPLIGRGLGMRIRYILKKELRIDPCLDIVGDRLPNHFLDRNGDTARELAAIGRLAEALADDELVLLYPEGTRFTPAKRRRVLERLWEKDPERHARVATLEHVLPPRPGGALTLLRSGYDVVFCAHSGLEGFASWTHLISGSLVGARIRVGFWRVAATSLPAEESARLAWLDREWAKVDRFWQE